jgi:hypothetical protein
MIAAARWWTRQWGPSADLRYQDTNHLSSSRTMTTPNLPDPRFDNRVLIYDPEAIKTALSTYFHALSKLPYIEGSEIVYPPAAGWPNITATNFAPLGKNGTMIALLKHLPYLRNPGLPKGYTIAFATFAIDYSAAPFTEPLDEDAAEGLRPDQYEDEEEKVKSWVVPLTMSQDHYSGCWWLLDTTDGDLSRRVKSNHADD